MFKLIAEWRAIKRLRAVEEQIATIESTIKQLELEWSETYDKIRRAMAKVAKRQEAIDKAEADLDQHAGEAPAVPSLMTSRYGLTPAQEDLQRAILRRRAGG